MGRAASKLGGWLALAVGAIVLANCLSWSAAIPFDDAPDEQDHYDQLEFVARTGRLPHYGEESFTVHLLDVSTRERVHLRGTDPSGVHPGPRSRYELRQTYLFSPQLPYALGGWFMRLLGGASVGKARLWSALCIALAASAVCLAGCALWPGRQAFAALAGLVFGLWPQMTFIGAYTNDDAFTVLTATFVLLACARVDRLGLSRRRAIVLGIALGLLGSAKYYVLALLPLVAVWAALHVRRKGRSALRLLALGAGIAALLAVIWPVRNLVLYGELLGRRFVNQEVRAFVDGLPQSIASRTPRRLAETSLHAAREPVARLFERGWVRVSLQSGWGLFGWMRQRMPAPAYITALIVTAGLLILSFARPALRPPESPLPDLFALPFLLLLAGLSLANSYFVDYQPQGRYLLACVPALALQIVRPLAAWAGTGGAIAAAALTGFIIVQNTIARFVSLQ